MNFAERRHRQWLSNYIARVELGAGDFDLSFRDLLVKTLRVILDEHENPTADSAFRVRVAMFASFLLFDWHLEHQRVKLKLYLELPTRFEQTTRTVLWAATDALVELDQRCGLDAIDMNTLGSLFRTHFGLEHKEADALARETRKRLDAAKNGPSWADIEAQIEELEAKQRAA